MPAGVPPTGASAGAAHLDLGLLQIGSSAGSSEHNNDCTRREFVRPTLAVPNATGLNVRYTESALQTNLEHAVQLTFARENSFRHAGSIAGAPLLNDG
jgi:hypothetical protein